MNNEELLKAFIVVSSENEKLQQENNNLKTSLDESQEVVIDLQQRIEKAVEYIKDHRKVYKLGVNQETDEFDYISTSPQVLLNILSGRSDE